MGLSQSEQLRLIGRLGWLLFAGWATVLCAWAIVVPDPCAQGWRLVLELLFLGRAVSIADGVTSGFSNAYLLAQSGPQDIILLLVLYPWIVAAYESSVTLPLVGRGIRRLRVTAARHKSKVEPWGALGLWIFVFFPFWSTGALVGGVVGYLLGMRTRVVFASVFAGHALSVVGLIWFFDAMQRFSEPFSEGLASYLPWIVVAVLLAVAVASRIYNTLTLRREAGKTPNE